MQPFYFLSSRSMTSATTRSDHRAKTTTARSSVNNGGRIQLFQNSLHMRRQNAPLFWASKLARKCESKHWCACGADGRSYGHVITKFSRTGRLPHFLSYGAPSTRALRARAWSSAINFKFDIHEA